LVRHPHIVEIQDFVDDRKAGNVWCVMEYLRGPNLKQVLRTGALPLARVLRIARQVAQALGAAHEVGVVHRDIKPENIMLVNGRLDGDGADDFVKVLDFGIAKLRDDAERVERPRTGHGEVLGTPAYMSPEQAQALQVDGRSDIYSLGTVLYVLLAGRLPFEGKGLLQMAMHLVTQPPKPLPAIGHSTEPIPAALSELVQRCLEKSPSRRFQSMSELDEALAKIQQAAAAEVEPTELDVSDFDVPAAPVFEQSVAQQYEHARKPPAKARWALILGLILAGLLAAASLRLNTVERQAVPRVSAMKKSN
jgi:serine/threonine-protein kinase